MVSAACFFDDPRYLSTVVAEKPRAASIAQARNAAGRANWPRFVRSSYTRLPLASSAVDAVMWLGTALGYGGEREALREFRRVLAPGGRLVIETLHRDELGVTLGRHEERPVPGGGTLCLDRRFDRLRRVMYEEQRFENGGRSDQARGYELRVYGEDELRRLLEETGFMVVGRHASLVGVGEPSPATPLVLVAVAAGPSAPGD